MKWWLYGFALGLTQVAGAIADDTPRFYGEQAFTISYVVTGKPETGKITEHVRNWGAIRVEVKDMKFAYGPVVKETKQRVLQNGGQTTIVDEVSGHATQMQNPHYPQLVRAMSGKSGAEFGKSMAASLGAQSTGRNETVAGHVCEVWTIPQLQQTLCVTQSGITLKHVSKTGPVDMTKLAVEVKLGFGGPDAAFAVDKTKVKAMPSMPGLMRNN